MLYLVPKVVESLTNVGTGRVSDPHRFNADPDTDPDPAFFLIADPDSGSGSGSRVWWPKIEKNLWLKI